MLFSLLLWRNIEIKESRKQNVKMETCALNPNACQGKASAETAGTRNDGATAGARAQAQKLRVALPALVPEGYRES